MLYKIKASKKFQKFFAKRTMKEQSIIEAKLELLRDNPFNHISLDISKMSGCENRFRLRINNYRIVYEVAEQQITIYILDAGNRGDIYK